MGWARPAEDFFRAKKALPDLAAVTEGLMANVRATFHKAGDTRVPEHVLGPLTSVIRTNDADVAMFGANKAAVRTKTGEFDIFHTAHTIEGSTPSWALYKPETSRSAMVDSIRSFNMMENGYNTFFKPPVVNAILKHADETVLSSMIPSGSTPFGFGGSHLAFRTPSDEIMLLGPPEFRHAAPSMLFPKDTIIKGRLMAERLERAQVGVGADDIVNHIRHENFFCRVAF